MARGTTVRAELRAAIEGMQQAFVRTNPVRALAIWHKGERPTLALRKAPKVDRHEAVTLSLLCAADVRKTR